MEIFKLRPIEKSFLWGKESWGLSTHTDGISIVDGGKHDGLQLGHIDKNLIVPIIIKHIQAKENLSIQVHPNKKYAAKNGAAAKNEMWYVLSAVDGAGIYSGLKETMTRRQFADVVANGSILDCLNFFPVQTGDCFFIPGGTIHAIGAGVVVYEVQSCSNTTYRLYDFLRLDANGNARQLHIKEAIEAAKLKRYSKKSSGSKSNRLVSCKDFKVFCHEITDKTVFETKKSFAAITIIEGSALIDNRRAEIGDTFFVPFGYGKYTLIGKCKLILVHI